MMKKEKKTEETVDIDDYDLRARLSKESKLTGKEIEELLQIDEKMMNKIKFRYKQRTSLYVLGDEKSEEFIRIDLTYTRMADAFRKINQSIPNYELEIEYGTKSSSKKESLYKMLSEIEIVRMIIAEMIV